MGYSIRAKSVKSHIGTIDIGLETRGFQNKKAYPKAASCNQCTRNGTPIHFQRYNTFSAQNAKLTPGRLVGSLIPALAIPTTQKQLDKTAMCTESAESPFRFRFRQTRIHPGMPASLPQLGRETSLHRTETRQQPKRSSKYIFVPQHPHNTDWAIEMN